MILTPSSEWSGCVYSENKVFKHSLRNTIGEDLALWTLVDRSQGTRVSWTEESVNWQPLTSLCV